MAVAEVLRLLSAAALGIFAGANLTEGFVLVSYWRALAPGDFLAWYAANDRRLLGFFGPLTTVTVLLAIAAAAASVWEGHPGRRLAVVAAVLVVVVMSSFFVYFRAVNAGFAAARIPPAAVPGELGRWAAWHWVRTGASLVACAAGLLALRR
jgi:hypothetical protein